MNKKSGPRGRTGSWLIITVLLVILAFSFVILYLGWALPDDSAGTPMTTNGYVAMALGIVATLGLGIGLMSLIFYSSRHGDDR